MYRGSGQGSREDSQLANLPDPGKTRRNGAPGPWKEPLDGLEIQDE
jgi:hypothetical protein